MPNANKIPPTFQGPVRGTYMQTHLQHLKKHFFCTHGSQSMYIRQILGSVTFHDHNATYMTEQNGFTLSKNT